jgi:hypothetical protein
LSTIFFLLDKLVHIFAPVSHSAVLVIASIQSSPASIKKPTQSIAHLVNSLAASSVASTEACIHAPIESHILLNISFFESHVLANSHNLSSTHGLTDFQYLSVIFSGDNQE